MNRIKYLTVALLAVVALAISAVAYGASSLITDEPIAVNDIDPILRDHEARIAALEDAATTTTTTIPDTTTTTVPDTTTTTTEATTTTTEPPPTTTTTTVPPPPLPTPTGPKFDIILLADNGELWTAPYYRTLPYATNRTVGWVDGDRVGYGCAYMFLQDLDTGVNLARVTFQLVPHPETAYGLVNDKFMAEGVRYFNGTTPSTPRRQLNDCPAVSQNYEPYTGPDVRPQVWFVENDDLLENRSYTTTTGSWIAQGRVKFQEVERIITPFTVTAPNSGQSTVYQRVTVLANFDRPSDTTSDFLPTIVVYYDTLVPGIDIANERP